MKPLRNAVEDYIALRRSLGFKLRDTATGLTKTACVVSHLNAKATQFATGRIYFFLEKSRNVHMSAGLLIKCNSCAESPN